MRALVSSVAAVLLLGSQLNAGEKTEKSSREALKKARELTKKSLNDKDCQVDSIIASVNGEPISLSDILAESQRIESRLRMVYSGRQLYDEVLKVRRQVLERIITRKLVLAEYEKKPFKIPRQYIENLLDEIMEGYGCRNREELAEQAEKEGTTLAELTRKARERVIVQVMINSFYFSEVNVTPRELFEYYRKHIAEFSSPPQFHLQLMFISLNRKGVKKLLQSISNDLKSRNSKIFTSLVVLHSEGPNASRGGDVGWIQQQRLRPEFAKAIAGRKVGDIVGPIKTEEGYYFLLLKEFKAGRTASFKSVLPELRDKIVMERRRQAFNSYVKKLKQRAVIRYFY